MDNEDYTDEENERLLSRLTAFGQNPKSLRPDVFEKCKELRDEIAKDSERMNQLIKDGVDFRRLSPINPKREALVRWLAKTP